MEELHPNMHPDDQVLLGWDAREWIDHEKNRAWWTMAGTVVVLIVMLTLIFDNWFTAFMVALIGANYYLLSDEKAEIVPVSITRFGVYFGDKFWQYSQLEHFWIVYDPPHVATLHFRVGKKTMVSEIIIQLEDVDPADVRDVLSQQIPEIENQDESFIHMICRMLKI